MLLKEAASFLGVSITTVWRWSKAAGINMRMHHKRCLNTVDMFSGCDGDEDAIQHEGDVLGRLYKEKRRHQIKREEKKC